MQDLTTQKLVWAILKAESEEDISRLVSEWHETAENDPELRAAKLAPHLAGSDFEAARQVLEKRFGRYHPRHKPAMDVLVAAAQSLRILRLRSAQTIMDEVRARSAKGSSL